MKLLKNVENHHVYGPVVQNFKAFPGLKYSDSTWPLEQGSLQWFQLKNLSKTIAMRNEPCAQGL